MNIKKGKNGFYKVESTSQRGKFYEVDPKKPWCECADFRFRELKVHGTCKHIKAVREHLRSKETGGEKKKEDIIKYLEQEGIVEVTKLIDRYGEETVNALIKQGEIIEEKGKVKVLK